MKQKIIIFFKRLWLKYKLSQAKVNRKTVVRVWAADGKGSNQAIFNMYDKYDAQVKEIESQLRNI